jgi:hypothetical protein
MRVRVLHSVCRVVPVHSVKEYRGIGGIAPLIPNISTRWG